MNNIKRFNLLLDLQPANAANQVVTYASNNEAVATVNAAGVVTTIAPGEATITVTTDDGGFTASVVITVTTTTQTVLAPAAVHELATGVAAVVKGTVTSNPFKWLLFHSIGQLWTISLQRSDCVAQFVRRWPWK